MPPDWRRGAIKPGERVRVSGKARKAKAPATSQFLVDTLTLLGSKDIQSFVVSFYPPDQAALDFAHTDIFDADNAQDVVWSRILHWLQDHQQDNSCLE